MVKEIVLTVLPKEEGKEGYIRKEAAKKCGCREDEISSLVLLKKSLDARHGRVRFHLRYAVYIGEEAADEPLPEWKQAAGDRRIIVVGSGPAGLFASLRLLEAGVAPVLIERGERTAQRKRDIAAISRTLRVDLESNYCFGAGGAGTFSDGKLYTRASKRGNIRRMLRILNYFGADLAILTEAHPHIGTDKLPVIIEAICDFIESHGGELHFGARCTGFDIDNGRIRAARVFLRQSEKEALIEGEALILASGHSALDMYELLAGLAPASLVPKTFAAGVRIEHPRSLIDAIQLGRQSGLASAEYRLSAQIEGRGVYSFCMCPGGFIVPSASAADEIVVNGMSPAARNSRWSNAGMVTEIREEDAAKLLHEFRPELAGRGLPAGLLLRGAIEREAFAQGDLQKAPAQRLTDFLAGRESQSLPDSSYTPGIVSSRLDLWMPLPIVRRLKAGFAAFDERMRGFISEEAVLVAPETRTSSPVWIRRDTQSLESPDIPGLFPAGEGAGYAGGILSSAFDGERAARAALRSIGLADEVFGGAG